MLLWMKMRYFVVYLLAMLGVVALNGDEIEAIGNLVQATAQQLVAQQEIHKWIVERAELKTKFEQGEEEKRVGFELVQLSKKIYLKLQTEHLESLFEKTYIEELKFFSSLGKGK